MTKHYPDWLKNAVVYQIWPASYQDSNGDGIGDLEGIISRLDYLAWLGIDTVWLNPICESSWRDGGYDVVDFYRVAERYGTNADLKRLVKAAKKKGIRILMDLVFAHTSMDHPWFQQSRRHERNEWTDRYIWTDDWWNEYSPDVTLIWGLGERQGLAGANFFYHQPKLNFGFAKPERSWQMPCDHPAVQKNRTELVEVMRHWLRLGIAGFRVDTAKAYIRRDPGFKESAKMWRWVKAQLAEEFPDMVLVAEWTGWEAIKVGFHATFMLHNSAGYHAAYLPGERATTARGTFFDPRGEGDITVWADQFSDWTKKAGRKGFICMPTSNHDTRRISTDRDERTLKQLFAFELTLPGVPFIYYGEEIGLKHLDGLPDKEGAYIRTGCRTPMQWDRTKNAGFSTGKKQDLYLPIDPAKDRPTVAAQRRAPASLLNHVRDLIALRREHPALGADGGFEVLHAKRKRYPLVYRRFRGKERFLVALNPSRKRVAATVDAAKAGEPVEVLRGEGAVAWRRRGGRLSLELPARSWALIRCT